MTAVTVAEWRIIREIWRQRWVDWGWVVVFVPGFAVLAASLAEIIQVPPWFWIAITGPYMIFAIWAANVLLGRRSRHDTKASVERLERHGMLNFMRRH